MNKRNNTIETVAFWGSILGSLAGVVTGVMVSYIAYNRK